MGKNKNKGKAKADAAELSKKERKALKAREAELQAELERRERKAAKKAAKRAAAEPVPAEQRKAKSPSKATDGERPEPGPGVSGLETHSPAEVIEAADRVLTDPNASEAALKSARAAKAKALEAMSPDELKARVKAKNEARKALEATADDVDRDDHHAVRVYNMTMANLGGGHFITSNEEIERARATLRDDAPLPTAAKPAKAKSKDTEPAPEPEPAAQVVGEVETETGRVFEAGSADAVEGGPTVAVDFAMPSDAPKVDFEVNGNNQYKVKRPSDGKLVGYTRATTYIDGLEYKGQLEAWKLRVLLEGVAVHDQPDEQGRVDEPVVVKVRELIHRRDVAIAKARKADRKGKLDIGELATYEQGAWADFKRDMDALAEATLELGGVHEKANKGTDLHALTEVYDREGMGAIDALLEAGKILPADRADIVAYAEAMQRAGIKVVTIEQVIVNHELKVAGRLDRIVLVKFPGAQRAVRVVGDIKTGRIDYSLGKIGQQVEVYSSGEAYDLDTNESSPLGVSKTKGLLIHLPAGQAECHIYEVDLAVGRKGNKLVGEVRAWRSEGKRAINLDVDLAALPAGAGA